LEEHPLYENSWHGCKMGVFAYRLTPLIDLDGIALHIPPLKIIDLAGRADDLLSRQRLGIGRALAGDLDLGLVTDFRKGGGQPGRGWERRFRR
jgi:hypothetical protein